MKAELVSGGRRLTSAELEVMIGRVASAMANVGVQGGDAVAFLLRNDFPFFASSLAARRLGAFTTPINWHATPDEIDYILADSEAKLLIGHSDLLAPLAECAANQTTVSVQTPDEIIEAYGLARAGTPRVAIDWECWLACAPLEIPVEQAPGAGAMIYTSGTTGRPKGVRRKPPTPEQIGLQARTFAVAYGLAPGEPIVAIITGPMYHSAPNAYGLGAVGMAKTIVLQPRFDPEDLLRSIEEYRVTHMHVVPTMFVRLLKLPEATRAKYDLSSLRFVVHGAAPCPPEVKRQMIAWWGPCIHEYYGSTETGLLATHGSSDTLAKPGTVGRALPGVSIRVAGDGGKGLSSGQIGDVYVRSEVMPDFTYHRRDAERSEIEQEGFVTVGDIGWLDADGFLFLCDRRKDMIISGGVNIYPAEIEAELLALAGVGDCAVFGIPDEEFGEAVCAWIEPQTGSHLDPIQMRTELARKLSRFKVPKVIECSAQLPREDSGKIFKRKLREPYWASAGRQI